MASEQSTIKLFILFLLKRRNADTALPSKPITSVSVLFVRQTMLVEEIPRCLVLREGVTKLLCRPGRGWMLGDGYVDESSTIVLED